MTSRHKWYTPAGILSRTFSFLAVKWAETPTEIFPAAVFAYGLIELFGIVKSAKIIAKFRRLQIAKSKKLRTRNGVSSRSNTTGGTFTSGTSS